MLLKDRFLFIFNNINCFVDVSFIHITLLCTKMLIDFLEIWFICYVLNDDWCFYYDQLSLEFILRLGNYLYWNLDSNESINKYLLNNNLFNHDLNFFLDDDLLLNNNLDWYLYDNFLLNNDFLLNNNFVLYNNYFLYNNFLLNSNLFLYDNFFFDNCLYFSL